MKEKKALSREELAEKLRHFCAYQERSRLQVLRKLKNLGCPEEEIPALLDMLAEENYLNEKRFVAQYVRSRASAKGWGPAKIAIALQRETGENHRDAVFSDADSRTKALHKLEKDLQKKKAELSRKEDGKIQEKLLRFCLSRGFDAETSFSLVKRLQTPCA